MTTDVVSRAGDGNRKRRGTNIRIPERKARAFAAYQSLIETADWFRYQLRGQMELFETTLEGFRLIELLHSHGTLTIRDAAQKRRCSKQNLMSVLKSLKAHGWVEYKVVSVKEAHSKTGGSSQTGLGGNAHVRKFGTIQLTAEGALMAKAMIRRHEKLVFAYFKALGGRELHTLDRLCEKLRAGNPLKLVQELMMEDPEE